MNINQFIFEVSDRSGKSSYHVSQILNAMTDVVTDALKKGREVRLGNFGTFAPKVRNARTGRNPHTGEAVPIPARVIPSFEPGRKLKNAVTKPIKTGK